MKLSIFSLSCLLVTLPATAMGTFKDVYNFKSQISTLNQNLIENSPVEQKDFEALFGETAKKDLKDEWLLNLAVTRHVVSAIVAQGRYEWLLIKLLNGKNKSKFVVPCCKGFAEYCATRKQLSDRYKKYMGTILGEISKLENFESNVGDRLLFSNTQKIMGPQARSSDLVSEFIYALLTMPDIATKKDHIFATTPELLKIILASRQNPLFNTSLGGMTPVHYLLSIYSVTQTANLAYADTIELTKDLRGALVPQAETAAIQTILENLLPLITHDKPATFRRFAGPVSTNNPEYIKLPPAAFAQKLNLPTDIQKLVGIAGENIGQENAEILTLAQILHDLTV